MTTTPLGRQAVDASAYAAAVRRELDDLTTEVAEELTDGLQADLADLAAESDQPLSVRLGPPSAYAAELRQAAGLPARSVQRPSLTQWSDARLTTLRGQAWWPVVASIGADLRPVWWVSRGVVAALLVVVVFGRYWGHLPWLIALVAVAGSVALGRIWVRHTRRRLWQRVLLALGNVFAVLMLPSALITLTPGAAFVSAGAEPTYPSGLAVDGAPVTNVFPYGPDGQPLTGVTLLDQDGNPLAIAPESAVSDSSDGGYLFAVPATTSAGAAWNVFPLRSSRSDNPDLNPYYPPSGALQTPTLPTPSVPPLPSATPSATESSSAATATPSGSASAVPTLSASTAVPTAATP